MSTYYLNLFPSGKIEKTDAQLVTDIGEFLHDGVGGMFECVSWPLEVDGQRCQLDIWINEEGLLRGLDFNCLASTLRATLCGRQGGNSSAFHVDNIVVGDVVVAASNEDGQTLGVPQWAVDFITEMIRPSFIQS